METFFVAANWQMVEPSPFVANRGLGQDYQELGVAPYKSHHHFPFSTQTEGSQTSSISQRFQMELSEELLELTRNASNAGQDSAIACEPDLVDQTTKRIESWIRHHSAIGQVVVVLLAQRGLNEYRLDEILCENRSNGSLRLMQHGIFDRSGRGSHAPRGISLRLLIPTSELLQAAISGYVWLNGRPAFARPLSEYERQLADRLNRLAPEGSKHSTMAA